MAQAGSSPQMPGSAPSADRLKEAAAQAEQALAAQKTANSLTAKAKSFADPKKREELLRDAYNKEIEAHGKSKKARMLQSGAFQGTVSGAGIGGAVSMGVGTVVGTLVGGVTAIPVTGLGALAGAGVGAAHGPWIKLGSLTGATGKKEKIAGKAEGEDGGGKVEEIDEEDHAEKVEGGDDDDDDAVPNPEALRQAAQLLDNEEVKKGPDTSESRKQAGTTKPERRKPRKLQRPGESEASKDLQGTPAAVEKKRPRKLETRSKRDTAAAS